jgi:hypothetical protein
MHAKTRTAGTAEAVYRLMLKPPADIGLSRTSPTTAPSGRVRMKAAQKRNVLEIFRDSVQIKVTNALRLDQFVTSKPVSNLEGCRILSI